MAALPRQVVEQLAENLAGVRAAIAAAAREAERDPQDVTLVAVTKYASLPVTRALVELGCLDLGESRPQDLWRKAEELRDLPVRWHLIGHLQRNKAARTAPLLARIHSIDSPRLLAALDEAAAAAGRGLRGLLEVNISGDETKHGFHPDDLPEILARLGAFPHVEIDGLMAMAGRHEESPNYLAAAGDDFEHLRRLRDRHASLHPLPELSIGMSDDYPEAVRRGATFVRVGSALFAGVEA